MGHGREHGRDAGVIMDGAQAWSQWPPQPRRLRFHSHPHDASGGIYTEASSPPRGCGRRVSQGHEPPAPRPSLPPGGSGPSRHRPRVIRRLPPRPRSYLDVIEQAVSEGDTLLIENIGETVDPVLDPLLGRNTIKKGR